MKKKDSLKKLSLSKETISALSRKQSAGIKGGVAATGLDNCTTKVDSCCYPKVNCNSADVKTGALSGCTNVCGCNHQQ